MNHHDKISKMRLAVVEPKGELPFGRLWPYAPAQESRAHVRIREKYGLYIGGKSVEPISRRYYSTINPATEEALAKVAVAGPRDVDLAVQSARRAYDRYWAKMPGAERAKYLFRIARLVQERARELAVLESLDGGKPIRLSRDDDLPLAAAHFFYYAGWADKLDYAFRGRRCRPLGVAGQVIPWNFPLLMAAWKIAPALATGNTVVLKPAETTPLTALHLGEILTEADLPPGVVNILTGDGAAGAQLVAHAGINKVAFTGSTEVGKSILQAVAGTAKRVTLELGGKSPMIVFDDASLDAAVEGIVSSIYYNQGHVCCAGSRLIVQEGIAPHVIEKLQVRLQTLRIGDPLDKNTDIGAINSQQQLQKIETLYHAGIAEGAIPWQPPCALPPRGFWFRPTFFTNVAQSHRIAREEIFGPILAVMTFRTPDEAVEKGNNTPYGLAASVWSDKGAKAFQITRQLRAGVVWNNTANVFDPTAPFGGYKESGFGREGGVHGLAPYVELQA